MLPDLDPVRRVIPPFAGLPTELDHRSPYPCRLVHVVDRLGTNPTRLRILRGLIRYRAALRAAGFGDATQWLAGSFVEGKDQPGDVDVVTWFAMEADRERQIAAAHRDLFRTKATKPAYSVDAYFVNVRSHTPWTFLDKSTYWFGLFSHTRDGYIWKGMAEVELNDSDDDAVSLIDQRESGLP
jgi:hypothetical protein